MGLDDDKFLSFVLDWSKDEYDHEKAKQSVEEYQQILKKAAQSRMNEKEIERCRVLNLECPCCKSIEKRHFVEREHNGIYGSGGRSWINQEYIICFSCGVHYTDLNKGK